MRLCPSIFAKPGTLCLQVDNAGAAEELMEVRTQLLMAKQVCFNLGDNVSDMLIYFSVKCNMSAWWHVLSAVLGCCEHLSGMCPVRRRQKCLLQRLFRVTRGL